MTMEVRPVHRCAQMAADGLKANQASAAELADQEILSMQRDDLIALLRDVMPLCLEQRVKRRLDFFDRPTLQRIFFLCRRCLRNQLQFVAT